ncbi:Ig-like domain-containing protein [Actinacidiphila bryophytorum]|uniref:Ig-like domain-containing protein n=1 Tax=Actinacidiphila bryophytorum TaxID=1436133 RepID=UPI0021769D51|nr:Ig-like domain-containing protein [Actinacidiphila bryophytorum]UWE10440.1 Ig-like domain-containing protein [Actinacidiphila bryophytorum]
MSAPLPRRPRLAAVSIAVAVAAGLSLTLAATPSTAVPEPVGSTSTLHDAGGSGQGPVTPVRSAKSFGAASAQVSAPQLTRDQVLDRASDWVGKGIPYNQGAYYAGYRTDCSGYASMAWDLSSSLDTTSFVPSGTAHWITKSDLKPGDAPLNDSGGNSGHIALFAGWTDSSQSRYWAYEFTGSGVHYRQVPYPYFSGYGTFKPVRADNVIDDPAPTPAVSTVTAPSAGDIVSGTVTLSAKVTDTVGTVTGALFYVDGELVGKDTSGPGGSYSVSLDTATTLSEGEHTLTVKGTNSAGQTGAASPGVSFFVANFAAASRTTGDFNGDGKADIGALYNYGNVDSAVWRFTSTGTGFSNPVKDWDSGEGGWNWDRSDLA